MEVTLKIRGLYATALTRFFLDRGLSVVSPSPVLQERFGPAPGLPAAGPAQVEIRDRADGQGVLIEGEAGLTRQVAALLLGGLPDAVCCESPPGEPAALRVEFPCLAKSRLDDLRNAVVPTLLNHHRMRLIASDDLDLKEREELRYRPDEREALGRDLERRLIWDTYGRGKGIAIEHVKPDGRVLSLSRGEILAADPRQKSLLLRRGPFGGGFRYDGLDVSGAPGDYALTRVREGEWSYSHTYFRCDGRWIGTYHNVNTWVECYPDRIRYVDLAIDVVTWPDHRTAVLDAEKLERHFAAGRISRELRTRAEATARELMRTKGKG